MVTISTADKALKTFYLGVLADQLNVGVNPLFAKIGQTSADVWGKEVKKLAPYGINGGVGSEFTPHPGLKQSGIGCDKSKWSMEEYYDYKLISLVP